MAPTAQWALQDFVRIAGEVGCTLYFENFIKNGIAALPKKLQERFSGLHSWGGLAELKDALRRQFQVAKTAPLLLAGRSTNLATFAARTLFEEGRRVLLTDLTWPNYRRILQREARRSRADIDFVRVRSSISSRKVDARQVIDWLAGIVEGHHCDGLFLPEVSHDGIRLPITEIVQAVRHVRRSVRVVVDGSQAFGQIPLQLSNRPCDFYLAGCHKWLGSHLPLGVGVFPNADTGPSLLNDAVRHFENGSLDDPFLTFLLRLETGRGRRFTETVNLSPLFACRGALWDAEQYAQSQIQHRLANARFVRRIAPMTGWTPLDPTDDFHSAAVLLKSTSPKAKSSDAARLRELFHERGVALTSYDGGIVRLSMPSTLFSREELGRLIQALALAQTPHRSCRDVAMQPAFA